MRVIVIGGAGHVGSLILPLLSAQHTLRVFDLQPPPGGDRSEYVQGDIADAVNLPKTLAAALADFSPGDALLYLAMGDPLQSVPEKRIQAAYDVNARGVYLCLRIAHQMRIQHAVYASSMSVYKNLEVRYFDSETVPPDATDLYGLTKRSGEDACQAISDQGMSVNVLRLCWPKSDADWQREAASGPTLATRADDLARVVDAALRFRDHYQVFMTSGDYTGKWMNMEKAKRLLDWTPQARPEFIGENHDAA